MSSASGLKAYVAVTAAYWGFTLTDGALRMLVLLHFYTLGYTPFMLASLFLLYETAGIFANLGFQQRRFFVVHSVEQAFADILSLAVLDNLDFPLAKLNHHVVPVSG